MRGVQRGEEKAARHRLDAVRLQRARGFDDIGLVERLDLFAARRREATLDDLSITALDERTALPGQLLHDRIMLDPLVPRDMDDVAKAFVRDHAGAAALVLPDG